MKFTPFQIYSDNQYIGIRDKRLTTVAYIASVIVILMLIQWIIISYLNNTYLLMAFHFIMMLFVSYFLLPISIFKLKIVYM